MFKCDKCGLCCRNLDNENFKELHDGDGICRHLDKRNNMCKIYESRPTICNVEKGFEVLFKDKINKDKYYELNYKVCEMLKKGER
ncbi:MAG: YkgJ family cysteine cluster protein [Clostridium sp.]|uniref:YkgJ family cysteine cluster protein n=1 Tax=Clostridium sp. TaxID=1506 RepID=UPI003F382086